MCNAALCTEYSIETHVTRETKTALDKNFIWLTKKKIGTPQRIFSFIKEGAI